MGIFGPDEPRYAAIGVEMARSGDWVTTRLWGQPWFEKPALLYWMTGLGALIGLGPETAPRLPVALTAVGLIGFLYLYLKSRLGCEIALHSSILLAGTVGWLGFGSVGVTDVPLTAHFTVCLLLVVFGGPAWLAGVFLGLAVLAKGLLPFVLFLPLVWWLYRTKRLLDLLWIAVACVAVAGPWYAAILMKFGRAFFDEFIVKHHLARAVSDSIQHVRPVWFYVPALSGAMLPWAGLLPSVFRVRDERLRFLGYWAVFGFVFLSLVRNKLPGYILPLVPVLCILIAAAIEEFEWTGAILAVTSAALVMFGLQVLPALPGLIKDGWTRTSLGGFQLSFVLVGLITGMAVWWIFARLRWKTVGLCVVSAIGFAGLLAVKFGPVAGEIDRLATSRPLSRTASRDGCVHPADRDLRYGLSYYWRFEVPECNDETLDKRIKKLVD